MPDNIGELWGLPTEEVTTETEAVDGAKETAETEGELETTESSKTTVEDPDKGQSSQETSKPKLILGRFKNIGSVAKAYGELSDQLGLQNDIDDYSTNEEIIAAYKERERMFSRRIVPKVQPTAPQEDFKQQITELKSEIAKLNPETTQEVDITTMSREQLYEMAHDDPGLLLDYIDKAGEKILNGISPILEQHNAAQQQARYNNMVENVASRHEDFNNYASKIGEILSINKEYIHEVTSRDPQMVEVVVEMAYKQAVMEDKQEKLDALEQKYATEVSAKEQERIEREKKVARLPGSAGRSNNQDNDDRSELRAKWGL